jgi:uncharacterized protein YcnI
MRLLSSKMILGALACSLMFPALAHVTVAPRASKAGAHEKYVVRVPTEGQVATASVEIAIPAGVAVTSLGAAVGHTYELKKVEGRIVGIVWTMRINPGEFAEFAFIARNPKEGKEIVWKAVQRFADGTSAQWIGVPGDKRPASITTLSAAEDTHQH